VEENFGNDGGGRNRSDARDDQHLSRRKPGNVRVQNSQQEVDRNVDRAANEDGFSRLNQTANTRLDTEIEQQKQDSDAPHKVDQRRTADETEVEHADLRRVRSDRHSDQD